MTRRTALAGSAGLAAGAIASLPFLLPKYDKVRQPRRSRVAILPASSYSQNLEQILMEGLRLFNLDVRGKRVLLKPNLVDYIPGAEINTHTSLVVAAAVCGGWKTVEKATIPSCSILIRPSQIPTVLFAQMSAGYDLLV